MIRLTETGEKFLALTATQQLQKWHKKGKPGKESIPVLPVHKLVHVPSARIKKLKKRENLSEGFRTVGDQEKSALKRNVEESMSKYEERFKAIGLKILRIISTVYCKQVNLVEKQVWAYICTINLQVFASKRLHLNMIIVCNQSSHYSRE